MKNLLVSFSGGETSAYMAQWLWKHKRDEYNMVFVYANTGLENWETIQFCRRCEETFGFKVHYIEAVVHHGERKANTYKEVKPWNLSTEGEPFEEVIKKHGIPNQAFPHCTRELKLAPIRSFAKEYFGGEEYYTAIGIRADEMDRMNPKRKEQRIIYPLIQKEFIPMSKPKINFWWQQQPFRLELKGYQGNCLTCWKKSDSKLFKIAQETPRSFLFMHSMEAKYGHYTPASRLMKMKAEGRIPVYPVTFFRHNRSAYDIEIQSKAFSGSVADDSQVYEGESCEIFTEC